MRWARSHAVELDARQTRWEHETGERLLAAATRLPASLRQLLGHTAVPATSICAAVATGTWPALEVELIVRWAENPVRILTGAVHPVDRLRYLADQQLIRCGLMLSSLLRHLQRVGQASASDEDDTTREIAVTFAAAPDDRDATLNAVTFSARDGEPVSPRWPVLAGRLRPGAELTVHTFPVDADVLAEMGPNAVRSLGPGSVLLVPSDAASRSRRLAGFFTAAEHAGTRVISAPDYTTTMDVAIAARLDRARLSRR